MSLLEMSLNGAVLIVAAVAVRTACVHYLPKKTFLVLWWIVLLELFVPYRVPSVFSVYSWTMQEKETEGVDMAWDWYFFEGKDSGWDGEMGTGTQIQQKKTENGRNQAVVFRLHRKHIMQAIWAAGCVVCVIFHVCVYIKCRRRFAESLPVQDVFAEGWIREHRILRPVQIRQSALVKTPLTYGVFCPVILMPENTDWKDTRQLSYVLMHELIHIRRFDVLTKMALLAAVSVHWFNPAVWLMCVLCNRDLELSCDETVVRIFGEHARAEYAGFLIDMEERKKIQVPLCSHFSKNVMEERIRAIMKIKNRSAVSAASAAVLVCMMTVLFGTSAMAGDEWHQNPPSEQYGQENTPDAGTGERTKGQSETPEQNESAKNPAVSSEKKNQTAEKIAGRYYVNITNESEYLDDSQAEMIFETIRANLLSEFEGLYAFDNFYVTFCRETAFGNEPLEGGIMPVDIEMEAAMTSVRHPEDSPYMLGMQDAIAELTDADAIEKAKRVYAGYLKKVLPYYNKPEPTGFSYQVHIPADAKERGKDFTFELFHRVDAEDGAVLSPETGEPYKEIHTREDGRMYIKENL